MRTIAITTIILLQILFAPSCFAQNKKGQVSASNSDNKVEVYYFHYTRRCITCTAVENVTKKSLNELYPEELKKIKITFKSINLDKSENKSIAKKNRVDGQALILVSGNKRFDLTETGFLYARTKPERLKEEIKNVIDPLIK